MPFKICFILFICSFSCVSQILTNETALKQTIQNCSLIIDGKADPPQKAFRGSNKMIYTLYPVTVTKIIAGKLTMSRIIILVEGGQIEENGMGYATGTPHGITFLKEVNSIIFCTKSEITNFPNSYLVYEQICYKIDEGIMPVNFLSEFYKNKKDLLTDVELVLSNLPQK